MQAVLFKIPGQEWRWLGGMTLLERNLRLLGSVGVTKAFVLHPPGDGMPVFTVPRELALEVIRNPLEIATADPLTILPALQAEVDRPFLLLDANLLVDPRVLDTMAKQVPPCFMVLGNGAYPPPWRVGLLSPRHLSQGNEVLRKAQRVSLLAVPKYNAELQGEAAPYCEKMHSDGDLHRGWHLLIDRVSKRPADVVKKYVAPPLENWLVRTLCDTAVTPNQVTMLSVAFAVAGASQFYQGWLLLALCFAWAALILDGVDGKLARVKLMTSPLGKLEDIVKFCCEHAWYLALDARLARVGHPTALRLGVLLTACNLSDALLGHLFTRRKGKTLDEMAPFDRRFRLIGGRRSIYLLILLAGIVANAPFLALEAVLGWAAITTLMHTGRAAFHLWSSSSDPSVQT
jgi:phosphatidylglycerophosphate synthase